MSSSSNAKVHPMLVTLATFTLISLGLLLNLVTACFPMVLWALQPSVQNSYYYAIPIIFVQCLHVWLLWTDKAHLAAYRFLTLPIRRALLPVVMFVAKEDAMKEKENVAFLSFQQGNDSEIGPGKEGLLQHFRSNTRRSYKKTLQTFQSEGIRVASVQCESDLDLRAVCPVIWEHQKRSCQMDNANGSKKKNVMEEFIKRFLVVSVVPDCVLDLFYNQDQELVAVSLDVRTGPVYYAFLYFARNEARRSGIWFYSNLHSLVRARSLAGVTIVNAVTHHMETKRNAGFQVAPYDDTERMDALFPWSPTERIPDKALVISLLDDDDDDDDDDDGDGHDKVANPKAEQSK
eukprot:scaffold3608_cov183-Amphora_coffeaeformis.AAC.19